MSEQPAEAEQILDLSRVYNAVAAGDAREVMRALRPIMYQYEQAKKVFSEPEGTFPDEAALTAQVLEIEEAVRATIGALGDDRQQELVSSMLRYHDLREPFAEELKSKNPDTKNTGFQVTDDLFNSLYDELCDLDPVEEGYAEEKEQLLWNLLNAIQNLSDEEKFDAYMIVAYACDGSGYDSIKRDALTKAVSHIDSAAHHHPAGEFNVADIGYYTARELQDATDTGGNLYERFQGLANRWNDKRGEKKDRTLGLIGYTQKLAERRPMVL